MCSSDLIELLDSPVLVQKATQQHVTWPLLLTSLNIACLLRSHRGSLSLRPRDGSSHGGGIEQMGLLQNLSICLEEGREDGGGGVFGRHGTEVAQFFFSGVPCLSCVLLLQPHSAVISVSHINWLFLGLYLLYSLVLPLSALSVNVTSPHLFL